MTEQTGVVLARNEGLIYVPGAVPITRGLVDTVERICDALGIPTADERREQREEQER